MGESSKPPKGLDKRIGVFGLKTEDALDASSSDIHRIRLFDRHMRIPSSFTEREDARCFERQTKASKAYMDALSGTSLAHARLSENVVMQLL
jgi:hypothetical protein